ncbi:MAG: LysM peptidoglycan-binding domain-containing protein [Bacteroidales bacterium]|nr:LysM peptidoglycan-binding domain-containing protein [Bacteroidales bacterium]
MRFNAAILISLLTLLFNSTYGQEPHVAVAISRDTIMKDGVSYYLHKAEKGQTVYSICKVYEITPEILLEDNPSLISGLKDGSTVLIRKGGKKQVTYLKHIVRWYDSISSIAKKYGVSEADILKTNTLPDGRLVVRQLLLIPDSTGIISQPESPAIKQMADSIISNPGQVEPDYSRHTVTEYKPSTSDNKLFVSDYSNYKFKVSLILPLGSTKTETSEMDANFLDFYEGFLLAVEDMKMAGMNINLQVLDMYDYPSGSILAQSGKLDKSNIIIGPIFEKDVSPVLTHAQNLGIPVVSPMDSKTESLVANNEGFFQINTSNYHVQSALLSSIPKGNHVTVIYEESGKDKELVDLTRHILSEKGITYSTISYNVLSGRGMTPKIGAKLLQGSMNAVVVPSNQEAFVSDVLRNLNLLKTMNGFNITIYGTSKWRTFESMDIGNYHAMNLHIALQHYIDFSDNDVKRFIYRYRALYGCEPNPYSYQAYDVAKYFLEQLYLKGPKFYRREDGTTRRLLQSDLRFERESKSDGFINTASRVIIYNPDYSVNISSSDF